jgi:hypothetical protein
LITFRRRGAAETEHGLLNKLAAPASMTTTPTSMVIKSSPAEMTATPTTTATTTTTTSKPKRPIAGVPATLRSDWAARPAKPLSGAERPRRNGLLSS